MNADPLPASPHLRRIVLTGFMGAGKSTVGRLLAVQLNWDFIDLDTFIELRTGLTIPAIFSIHGETHFRDVECEALGLALRRDNLVLALGGGAPETAANRLLLEQTPATAIIYLEAPFATLYHRCMIQSLCQTHTTVGPAELGSASLTTPASAIAPVLEVAPQAQPDLPHGRPNLADPTEAHVRFLRRQPLYQGLAHHTIDTSSHHSTHETVNAVLAELGLTNLPEGPGQES